MLSEKFRSFVKDVALVAMAFTFISAAYFGFAVAERYRALTQAYMAQAEQIIQVLQRSQPAPNRQPNQEKDNK